MIHDAARELDRLGYGRTAVHRLDGRAKLLVALVFVACVASFPKYAVAELLPFFALPVALAILGRVPARPLLRALAVASPFAVLVGILNPLLDRAPLLRVDGIVVTGGVASFASIVVRFVLCLGMVVVLIATTSMPGLLHALVQLRVPRPFVVQIQMLYRYLFLLAGEGERLALARRLRDPRRSRVPAGLAGRLLSALLWRTWERADRVYRCMKTRGFRGDFPFARVPRFRPADAAFLAGCSAACLAARVLPVVTWLGTAALRAFA